MFNTVDSPCQRPGSAGWRAVRVLLASIALLTMLPRKVDAAPWPRQQPIRLVVPFTAGGASDVLARMLAVQLSQKLGQTVLVENRAGASGGLGARYVAGENPNGYVFLLGSSTLAANAALNGPAAGYDLNNDFAYVGKVGQFDSVLVVPSARGLYSIRDLIALMRDARHTVRFGSAGVGSMAHLGSERFKQATQSSASHIPYRGESAALADLIRGDLTFQLCAPFICAPRVQDGSLRALAVMARQRSRLLRDVPTIAEAGVPGVEAGVWYFLAAPRSTPSDVVARMSSALNEVLSEPRFGAQLAAMALEVESPASDAQVRIGLQAEMQRWQPVIKVAGITKDSGVVPDGLVATISLKRGSQ